MSENGLVPYDEIRHELETAESFDVLGEAKAQIEAATVHARRLGMRPAVLEGVELSRRCERRFGQLDAELNPHGGSRNGQVTGTSNLALRPETRAEWRKLGAIPEERFEAGLAACRENDEEAYRSLLLRTTTAERLVASDENEWYTPAEYIEAARRVMGGIDLDPASCAEANETVQAKKFYSEDGLDQPWSGRMFLNPPYGRLAGDFATKAVDDYEAGHLDAAVLLVNAHCTDTAWFQCLWCGTLCFTDHRIDFDSGQRDKTSTSTHGSVFAYFGPDRAKFAREFSAFGAVVRTVTK
jgi:hypothetical protein